MLWYLWQREIEIPFFGTGPKEPYSPACEVSVWRVDALPPSRSASRLRNARRCWRGNAPPPSRRGVPDGGRIILLVAGRMSISDVAATVGSSRRFVYKWVQRFLEKGLEGLADKPGRGYHRAPRQPTVTEQPTVSA